jgi:hypothetical protein
VTSVVAREEGAPALVGAPGGDVEAGAILDLIASVYRLLKLTRMYEENNQALMTGANTLVASIQAFCAAHRVASADLMFASETVFVNGQMPKLSRDAYARAMDLAELLDKAGVSSLTIPRSASAQDLVAFLRVLLAAIRDPARKAELADKAGFRGIRARKLRRLPGTQAEGDRSPAGRVVRTYACAVVLLRRLHADCGAGRAQKLPPGLFRIAQRIVTHAEEEAGLLVALAASRSRENDEANVSVATALVAVLMARQVTKDRAALANVVQSALVYHLGQARLMSHREASVLATVSPLSDDEQDRLAASGAAAIAALDRVDATTLPRAVIAFEAQWMRRAARLGPLYNGKRATSALGRILAVARSFAELMAPGPYAAATGPEDAIQFLSSRANDETERAYVKLLTGGLGIFPPGTMVELSTGEVGVVMRVPAQPVNFARPPVRVMYDDAGNLLETPFDVDLASPSAWGATQRLIRRSVEADQQQTQAMRAYVLSVTRGDTTEQRRAASANESQSGKRPIRAEPADPKDLETGIAVRAPAPLASSHPEPPPPPSLACPEAPVSSTRPEPPSSGASTTARRRRSFEDRPKVFDPRAEPDDDGPHSSALTPPPVPAAPRESRREPPREMAPASRVAAKTRQEALPTRPAMDAVRPPTDVHERRTAPPPPDPDAQAAQAESAPTRGFTWEDMPRDVQQKATIPKSTVAGTRKVAWADYGKLVEGAADDEDDRSK